MQKVDLTKVLDLLIAEEQEEAGKLLHEWFVGKSKAILEEIMQEDDAALDDIEDAKAEIQSEEFYSDIDLDEASDEDEEEVDVDFGGEEGEVAGDELATDDAVADLGDELGAHEAEDEVVADKVEDLEAQLAELKAEFDKLMGLEDGEAEVALDVDGDGEADLEADVVGIDLGESEELEEEVLDEAEEELDEGEEVVAEDEDFVSLEESFELERVADPDLSGDETIGDGEKIHVETHSPLPNKKPVDRVGGKAVEIKGKTHKGYDRETPPAVEGKPLLKNQVKNAKEDLTPVKKGGDASALLNKAPAADKGKSPIGGGAVDLRGSDFKRK